LNLLDNATKYSDDAKYIRIGMSQTGSAAIIVVEDHGVGIPNECLGRIFDKFYRVPNEKGREMRGSGLGLALTKHIIEAHRGTIGVESNEGKGSFFTIKIPLQTGATL
jgi:signal transduction histidine kinase